MGYDNFARRLWVLLDVFRLNRARSLSSKGNNNRALEILLKLELPNGLKQVVMVEQANCLYRIGETDAALRKYLDAIDSEKDWGKRKDRNESEYIVRYSELFSLILKSEVKPVTRPALMPLYERLLSLDVGSGIKRRLPLPPPSSFR